MNDNGALFDELEAKGINHNVDKVEERLVYKRLRKVLQWVPPIWVEKVVISSSLPVLVWVVTFLLLGEDAMPGGQTFGLLVLIFFGIATGYALELFLLPPLLGMLAVGMAVRNVPGIQFASALTTSVSSPLRQIALVVILIRAGLGLDPKALLKLSTVVVRLAFGPCVMEALTVAIAAYFVLSFPLSWGFILGFVLAAVSPAVTVPCLLALRDKGYGVAKGIPTIVIAAASMDDILAISAFGVALGFALAGGESLTMSLLQGPIEVVLGITFGLLWGLGMGFVLGRGGDIKERGEATMIRLIFMLFGGCLAVFGFQYVGFPGSGALGCLVATFVAASIWRHKGILEDNDDLNWAFQTLWFIFQPLLFGLIGSEIDFSTLDYNVVLLGLICLGIGLVVRIMTSFYMVACSGLSVKERVFVALAWLPKATVQAAIGPVAYDLARQSHAGGDAEKMGLVVLTVAVLSILITAPIGAIAIMIAGPQLLNASLTSGGDSEKEMQPLTNNHEKTEDNEREKAGGEDQISMIEVEVVNEEDGKMK